jgi:hypothetical protein
MAFALHSCPQAKLESMFLGKDVKVIFVQYNKSRVVPRKSQSSISKCFFLLPDSPKQPHFDLTRYETFTVQQGATAFLPCVVRNLGNESVKEANHSILVTTLMMYSFLLGLLDTDKGLLYSHSGWRCFHIWPSDISDPRWSGIFLGIANKVSNRK